MVEDPVVGEERRGGGGGAAFLGRPKPRDVDIFPGGGVERRPLEICLLKRSYPRVFSPISEIVIFIEKYLFSIPRLTK